jgi:hypothetical protein
MSMNQATRIAGPRAQIVNAGSHRCRRTVGIDDSRRRRALANPTIAVVCRGMRLLALLLAAAPVLACGSDQRSAVDAGPTDAAATVDAGPGIDGPPALSVPDATYLDQLTSDQATALCTWMVDVQGGPHTITCTDGTQITIDPVADCLQNPWPHCQVGSLRACIEAQVVDQCGAAPAACTAFYQCAGA